MEILGIGLPELFFIVLIALILINPKDMRETGLTLGRWLNKMVRSDTWKAVQDVQKLPTKLMREANLNDLQRELGSIADGTSAQARNVRQPPKPQVNVEAQGYSQPLPPVIDTPSSSPVETPPTTPPA